MVDIHRVHGALAYAILEDGALKASSWNSESVSIEDYAPIGFVINLNLDTATDLVLGVQTQTPINANWCTVVKKSGGAYATAGSTFQADGNYSYTFGDVTGDDLRAIMGAATAFRFTGVTTGSIGSDTILLAVLLEPRHKGRFGA